MSETKFEQELTKFDPTIDKLQKIAKEASELTVTDFSDKTQVAQVRTKRLELRDIRVSITKTGKALRDDANAFAKAVIAKEKELVAVIEPEENRLEALEDEADRQIELARRRGYLPDRKARLEAINDGIEISDDELLELDDAGFINYYNSRESARIEAERIKLEEEKKAEEIRKAEEAVAEFQRKEAEAKAEEERKVKLEAEEKAKRDAEQKRIDEANAKIEAEKRKLEEDRKQLEHDKEVERVRKEAEERAKKETEERIAREAKEKEEAEKRRVEEQKKKAEEEAKKLEKEKKYQTFLKDIGYHDVNKDDFHFVETETEIKAYLYTGTYKKN